MFKNSSSLKIVFAIVTVLLGSYFFLLPQVRGLLKDNQKSSQYTTLESLFPHWQKKQAAEQKKRSISYKTFHEFSFSDSLNQSQITFKHIINPDGGIHHKPVHYDHGNGIIIGDVDQDGDYDIFFISQVGQSELWRNLGNGKFENMTQSAGLDIIKSRSCISASFADIDNDGDPDLYISTIREGNYLFENNGKGKFTDISKQAGVDWHGHSSGICFFDYNLDGLLDIFVANVGVYTTGQKDTFTIGDQLYDYYVGLKDGFAGHLKPERSEPSILYKNLGNNLFENVTEDVNLIDEAWIGDATILDANEDGYPDLYLTNMQGNDEYYENINGERFIRKSRELFPKTSWGAMGIKVFDFNNDGLQDIYITDMHSDMGENATFSVSREKEKVNSFPEAYLQTNGANIAGNSFFLKKGKNQYDEISDKINAENYWPWGLSTGDLNADGYEDVFVIKSMNYPFRYTENKVLLNEEGQQFVDSEYLLEIEPRKNNAYAKEWFVLDCDKEDKQHKHCYDKKGKTTIWGALGSRSSVIFDLDNDGDLDIVTNEYNAPPMVLISNLSEKKTINYLKIKLNGALSNRDGIGATVIIKAGTDVYTKVMDGKSGYLSQSSMPLYFGLGKHKEIKNIEVKWPSGISQIIPRANLPMINSLFEIQEKK